MTAEPTIVVALLGDSISAGNPGWDPDPARRALEDPGDDPTSQYGYWATRKDPRLVFVNHGIGGERSDEIRARFDAGVEGADAVVVQGGINDVVQGRSLAAADEDLRAMVRRAKELGLGVVIADVLPWNNGWPDAEATIRELNERIAAIGRDEAVAVLPFHETLEDPDRPGRMRADWTADGNHPSVAGHRRLGELAFRLP